MEALSFDEWFNEFGDQICIELAENGADREMGFDLEKEYERRYSAYLDTIPRDDVRWPCEIK